MRDETIQRTRSPFRAGLLLVATVLGLPLTATAQVLWSDEFNAGTAPNSCVWTYDLGAGGWGNSELQEYTNAPANVRVEGGLLIVTAQRQVSKGAWSGPLPWSPPTSTTT